MDHTSYRDLLRQNFEERKSANPRYSLRAFARDTNLDPGQLSAVLSGKKNISLSRASEISKKLFSNPRDMLIFFHSVELELAPDSEKKNLQGKIDQLRASPSERKSNVKDDEFEVISNWYNLPILELAGIPGEKVDPDRAATYFGISKAEASAGLMALLRLGFVEKKGEAFRRIKPVVTTTDIPSFGIRVFHQQMIKKALDALFGQSIKKRYLSAATLSFPTGRLEEVKKLIEEHEARLIELSKVHREEPDQVVYQINSQVFSLRSDDFKS